MPKIPHTTEWSEIIKIYPYFLSYFLSFLFIGIYWVNHHHLISTVNKVNTKILWLNMLLLFFLSLIPWGTGFMGENHFEQNSVIVYSLLCIFPALAYSFLSNAIIHSSNPDMKVLNILCRQKNKEYISLGLYFLAIVFSFIWTPISLLLLFTVSATWIMPNKEIEKIFE